LNWCPLNLKMMRLMDKQFPRSMARTSLSVILFFLLLLPGLVLNAQSDNPPAPPDFTPTLPDDLKVPEGEMPRYADVLRQRQEQAETGDDRGKSGPEETASNLVDEEDPRMQEMVGLIRIPDMGTNEVLEMLENFTGKPILRQQTLPNVKITFFSQEPLTRGEAILAIESLLSLNGIAITPLGEQFIKAVPANIINAQGAPVWEGSTLDATPTQKIYEKLFRLDFLDTPEATQMIQPLMSQGTPIAFEKSGLILISDALVNLQRIERMLKLIDQPAALNKAILYFPLDNLEATELIRRLDQIAQGPLSKQLGGNTSFEADERTNQLIVFTHPSNEELIRNLVGKLDIDVAPLTATKVYNIRYADATEVVSIIEQVVTGQREVRESGNNNNAASAARRRAAQQRANQAAAAARSEGENLQFSDFLTIVPDERANTIVASGTNNDLRYLESLIEQIDTLLAQVRIEVVITEVRLQEGDTRGIDSFAFGYNTDFNIDDGTARVDDKSATIPSEGGAYGVTFPSPVQWGPDKFGIEFVLNAAKTKSNVSVLSAPTIVTTHNKEASVSVGEERPVLIGQTSSGVNTNIVTNNIQFKDVKLELKVTPLIGMDGVIQMEIDQSNQSVIGDVEIGDGSRPIIGTRKATSFVSVGDGELVVLGGLQALDTNLNENKMAILGKLPILGELFTKNTEDRIRTELLIFIRPTIVRTTKQANADAEKMVETIESSEDVNRYLREGTFRKDDEEPESEKREIPRRNKP